MKSVASLCKHILIAFAAISAMVALTSCSSTRDQGSRDYYGYHNPSPHVQLHNDAADSDALNSANSSASESVTTQTPTPDQSTYLNSPAGATQEQYSTTYADGTPLVINNYYSSSYTPVITPWWNTYYSSWSYMQPGFHISYGYSPWTSWRYNYDPWYGADYCWGSNWYAPWYGCNPYYGFGYRPYFTYYDSYYGRPWYAHTDPWGGYNDGYTSSSSRNWGSGHAPRGSAGTNPTVGGYANPGGRERAVPLGTTGSASRQETRSPGFGRVRTESVDPVDNRNSSSTNGATSSRTSNSPFEEPRVVRPDQGRIRPGSQSSVDVSNPRSVVPARVNTNDAQVVPRMEFSTKTTQREFIVPRATVQSTSPAATTTASSKSTTTPAASSGSQGSSSSSGGRRR